MKIEISDDKSSATIDGVEYELKKVRQPIIQCLTCGKEQYPCEHNEGKKISEWLQELPDGYRELALANFKEQGGICDYIVSGYDSLNMINCFNWASTKEGHDFWYEVFNAMTMENKTFPPLPKPKFEVWKPKVDDLIYEISYNGDVEDGIFFSDQCFYTAFKTEAEAVEAHKKAMFNYEVEMFIKEKNEGWLPDWTNVDQIKCLITFNDGFLDCDFCRTYKATSDCKYFKSREIGEEIIAKFDNEKLVKWWI